MQNLSVNKKPRLIAPGTALIALVAVAVLLFLLHSNDQAFAPNNAHPDEVSANYNELLLKQEPSNDALRLRLIDLYLGLAQFEKAQHHWQLLQNVNAEVKSYYHFKIDAQTALGLSQDTQYSPLRARLQKLSFENLSTDQQVLLADLALQLDAGASAALIYEHLANTHQGQQQLDYLDLAAKWYFADSQYAKSAQLHALLAEKTMGQQRVDYQRRVVANYLAGNDPTAAVNYLQQLVEQPEQKLSNEQLTEAVATALLVEDLQHALSFNRLLIAQDPENLEARLTDLQLSIAVGDIEHAWQSRHWLLDSQPNSADVYTQMAQLGEWNNAFPEALDLWMQALDLQYDAKNYEHAWRLSIQLYDFERSLQLLSAISEQRQLTDIELQALFYSHESRGTPTQAEKWLRDYIVQYPQHRLAWTYLLQNLENTEQYSKESEVWSLMAKRFALQPKELGRWAETYLLNFDLEGAWQVLSQANDADIADSDYWHLKASVAWELENDEQFLLAFQRMEQDNIALHKDEMDQLIDVYTKINPEKALELTLRRWGKWHQEQDLMSAVYLAVELSKWELLQSLIDESDKDVKLAQSAPILFARASIAERQLNHQLAENILLQAIELYPSSNLFRERLLWLYIDTNQREPIKMLLAKWQKLAEQDGNLWLAFAAANQLLNRSTESIAWYQRHITLNPSDWLAQAAFADALESAEYFESALIQRRALLNTPILNRASEANYRTWLNLLAANYGQKTANDQALAWQDGTQSMLQLWFEQQLALLNQPEQDQQKTAWLTWAKQKNLVVGDFEQVEEALRTFNLSEIQRLLVSQRMPKEQQVAALKALNYRHRSGALALSELGDEHPTISRQQLRNQALEELKVYPQGALLGWQKRDFGGVTTTGAVFAVARVLDDHWYGRIDADKGDIEVTESDTFAFAKEEYVSLALNRQLHNGSLDLSINHSQSDLKSRSGASIARNWQITQKSNLSVGYDWKDRTDSSGLMYAVGQKNSLWLRGSQQITARDSFSWGLEKNQYETRYNDKLSSGKAFELQITHTVFFQHPTWLVKAGFDYQDNNLDEKILTKLPNYPVDNQPLTTSSLLVEKYKYAYLGTSLQRGVPGFLNRTEPQYTWMIDAVVGQQWPENKITYSISAGIGTEVFGDDELALNFAYQSAPKSQLKSKPGGTLGVSYSLRFGR